MLILSTLCECCISFSMTSYKRCDRLLNCEVDFIKHFYPIYYNVISYLLWLNVGKTKKANSGRKFPKLMARYLHLIQETESESNLVRFLLSFDFQSLHKPRHLQGASLKLRPPWRSQDPPPPHRAQNASQKAYYAYPSRRRK